MWKSLNGLARIVRPLNCGMFFSGTVVGGIIVAGAGALQWPGNTPLILASVSATLVGATGNVINDLYDVEIDRLNRPMRPLPSGIVTPNQARILWVVLAISGLAVALLVSALHLAIAVSSVVLLVAYSARLKSVSLIGNVVVSVVVATSLVYGALSIGGAALAIPAAIFALVTTMSRELVKDIEDLHGDRARGVGSFAVRAGTARSAHLASALLLVTIGLTPTPYLLMGYSGLYLLLMVVSDGFLLSAVWWVLHTDSEKSASRASSNIKAAMIVGLAALAASGVGPA